MCFGGLDFEGGGVGVWLCGRRVSCFFAFFCGYMYTCVHIKYVCMDGWMDGWMSVFVCVYVYLPHSRLKLLQTLYVCMYPTCA